MADQEQMTPDDEQTSPEQEQTSPEQPTFEQHTEHEPATEDMADAWSYSPRGGDDLDAAGQSAPDDSDAPVNLDENGHMPAGVGMGDIRAENVTLNQGGARDRWRKRGEGASQRRKVLAPPIGGLLPSCRFGRAVNRLPGQADEARPCVNGHRGCELGLQQLPRR